MTKYLLSFLSGLSLTFLIVFFIKLAQNNVQRIDVSAVILSFSLLILFFGYYAFRRLGASPKK